MIQIQKFGTAFAGQKTKIALLAVTAGLLVSLAALNGGAAPVASAWDGLGTSMRDMLTSTWTIALALIALVAAVWQIAHGKGYGQLGVVLGLMAVALIGPGFVTTVATATRSPDAQVVVVDQAAAKCISLVASR